MNSFAGISIECLLVVLCGLLPVHLLSSRLLCHFDTASSTSWDQNCFICKPIDEIISC